MIEENERKPALEGLATWVIETFTQCVSDRIYYEYKWLEAKEHKEGNYTQDTAEEGSKAHVRSTRTRIKGANSRINNVLFPSKSKPNWKINPTKSAELSPDARQAAMKKLGMRKLEELQESLDQVPQEQIMLMQEQGQLPDIEALQLAAINGDISGMDLTREEIEDAENEEARKRANEMSQKIEDQLAGSYAKEARKVVNSGNTYGTGWLKGPLAMKDVETHWVESEGGWALQEVEVFQPYYEFVPIWDVYPYPISPASIDQVVGYFHRHLLTPHKLLELMRVPGVRGDLIQEHIKAAPHGDQVREYSFESLRRGQEKPKNRTERLYEMIEYVGYISGHELSKYEVDLEQDLGGVQIDEAQEYKVIIWSLNSKSIRFKLFPYDNKKVQVFHRYVYAEPEFGIYGDGVADDNKDAELIYNAALRGLLNNTNKIEDAIYEINVSRLHDSQIEGAKNIAPGDRVLTTGINEEAAIPAIKVHQVDSRLAEFRAVMEMAKDIGDESTAQPRYSTYGANQKSGAAATAKGLGMLMTQADLVNQDPVSNFDTGITKSFLAAMVEFNMQFSDDDSIKGDFDVIPIGSSTLMDQQAHAERVEIFAANTANPLDAPWVKRGALNRERAKVLELNEDMVLTEDEYAEQQRRIAESEAQASGPAQGQP